MKHAMEWDTTFVIPPAAIAADSVLFRECGYDFSEMCRYKQNKLAGNRITKDRIDSIFGSDGKRIPGVDLRDIRRIWNYTSHSTIVQTRKR